MILFHLFTSLFDAFNLKALCKTALARIPNAEAIGHGIFKTNVTFFRYYKVSKRVILKISLRFLIKRNISIEKRKKSVPIEIRL